LKNGRGFYRFLNNLSIIQIKKHSENCSCDEEKEFKEELTNAIKALDLKEKLQAIALNHYLAKKKNLDEEREAEIKALTLKYEKLA